jgi:iron complex transport system substrate-binding protein
VSGKDTFQDELIQIAGGVNAFSDKQSHAIANIEEFINKNPDILMINSGSGMGGNSSEIIEYFKNEPRLSGLSAITSDNIIIVESSVADRPGHVCGIF